MAGKKPVKTGTATSKELTSLKKDTANIIGKTETEVVVVGGSKVVKGTRSGTIDGEFRGDFTRDTFDPLKHFTRVLMQQGRVQLDADWNEQSSILLHFLQTLAADLIGPFGGPEGDCGFKIAPKEGQANDFLIGKGRYYVNGVLCENEEETNYLGQLSPASTMRPLTKGRVCVVYIDAWERALSYIEDAGIREVALNGPDTAARAKTEWMVRTSDYFGDLNCANFRELLKEMSMMLSRLGRMRPDMSSDDRSNDICIIDPDTRYRGLENHLYRVEVHTGGTAANATFKWSRENGSVQFPILALEDKRITLAHLGRDESLSLRTGDYVEIIDDDSVKQVYDFEDVVRTLKDSDHRIDRRKLYEVAEADRAHLTVTLKEKPGLSYDSDSENHPLLRRWDHAEPDAKDNCISIDESADRYFDLEDGIRIQFSSPMSKKKSIYLPGDYWLLPARVVTGAIDWPVSGEEYVTLPPHGITHGYAPLGIIYVDKTGSVELRDDCRCVFTTNRKCYPEDK